MPDVVSPPAGASVSADVSPMSQILSDLNGPSTSTGTGSVDPAIAEEINAVPGEEETEAPLGVPEEPAAEEQPQVEDDTQKPEIQNLEESRWKRVHAGYKYTQEIGRALGVVGEDGRVDLSLFPSVDEIKEMRTAFSDRIGMEHDFSSADPQNAAQWIKNWNSFSPDGMATVASMLPDALAAMNQKAYVAVAQPVMNRFLDYMYQTPGVDNPELREKLLNAARMTEWWLNGMPFQGGYRDDQRIQGGTQAQPPPDPREQQLAARERQIQEHDQRARTEAVAGFDKQVNGRIWQNINAEVDKSLAALKPLYPNDVSFQAVRDHFVNSLKQTLVGDKVALRQFDVARERARQTRSAEDQESLVNQYLAMTRRALHTIRGPFVTNASKGFKQASDARHQSLQRSANKVGATSAAAPRPQGITPKLEPRRKEETGAEFQMRQILETLGA